MCAIGYYLERAGIMTTGISLVRENAESLAPPRSLWVSFPLGRPLGVPDDPAFQHQVIAAALDLLTRPNGPVLEDFPFDAPPVSVDQAAACPVSFAETRNNDGSWPSRLAAELSLLRPWYGLGRRRRQRTTVGACDDPIEVILVRLGEMLEVDQLPATELKWFKLAIEDAKAYYSEALTAQPGEHDFNEVQRILWQETQLGAALRVFYAMFQDHPKLRLMARIVAPRDAIGASTGEELDIGVDGLRSSERQSE